jgi:hypothetical protein
MACIVRATALTPAHRATGRFSDAPTLHTQPASRPTARPHARLAGRAHTVLPSRCRAVRRRIVRQPQRRSLPMSANAQPTTSPNQPVAPLFMKAAAPLQLQRAGTLLFAALARAASICRFPFGLVVWTGGQNASKWAEREQEAQSCAAADSCGRTLQD